MAELAQSAGIPDVSGSVEDDLLPRGVTCRSIVLDSVRNDKQAIVRLSAEGEAGAEVRTLPTLPARVRIFDQRQAVISVGNLTCVAGELVVVCNAVVHSYVTLFAKLWAEAEPLREHKPRRGGSALTLHLEPRHVQRPGPLTRRSGDSGASRYPPDPPATDCSRTLGDTGQRAGTSPCP